MAINSYPDNSGGEVNFPDQLIDPVSKFRVSNPENLIDTDFEYGLQPTKWETVELINNTPSFFSKSGDTTIDGISSIITNAGTREIIVKTELDHGLAVGIPINVTGTKSITADGAYIINSIPDPKTFTYLCKDNQADTNSILDLYSSIITGEFFQGSQLRISDSDGIVTDAEGTSILTVTTNTTHGFGENTPFYFLNLNSTVAQEFQAANTASKSFDASNSATAQTFDGSNSLSSVNIDWSNSATFGGTVSNITATSAANDTITVAHTSENFNNLALGTPLYYSVSSTGGYFNTNPRGVVFLKTIDQLGTSTSTFKVSLVPDGDSVNITENLSGTFQIANQARTFAGNNINPLTQTVIDVEVGTTFNFDGGNQGYTGAVQGTPPNNTITVLSYTGTSINGDGASSADYYVGAMVLYSSTGTAATGLANNTTYFVTSITNNGGGNYTFSVASLPGGTPISITTGSGSGTQTFARIGISVDKDIVHIPNSGFAEGDMLEYIFPVDGRFEVVDPEEEKRFYFVDTVYDTHNYKLNETLGFKPIVATGGTILPEYTDQGRTWKAHLFSTVGSSSFVVTDEGADGYLEYLVVAGGGGGGEGGGGAGGFLAGSLNVTPQTYSITVGAGGTGSSDAFVNGTNGGNSTFSTITAIGGGRGGTAPGTAGATGGSGGGGRRDGASAGAAGTAGQGFAGGTSPAGPWVGAAGGGGAEEPGKPGITNGTQQGEIGGAGGSGKISSITGTAVYYAGGGGGGTQGTGGIGIGGVGGGGNGSYGASSSVLAVNGTANTGGGGGGTYNGSPAGRAGNGGSGIVVVRYPITPAIDFVAPVVTGGTITESFESGRIYKIHSFTNVGTSTLSVSNTGSYNAFEALILGGGGGGSKNYAGAGGAGGLILRNNISLSAQSYSIVVGAGGLGNATTAVVAGQSGGNSSAFGLVALGGGGGMVSQPGIAGGSGGGGSYTFTAGGLGQQPTSASGGFGNSGGQGGGSAGTAGSKDYWGGGGGGAGTPGSNGVSSGIGGNGIISRITGQPIVYGTGGGGGQYNQTGVKVFATGGSNNIYGNTGGYGSEQGGDANTPNRGSGGGGTGGVGAGQDGTNRAGNGSSGVVIVKYVSEVIEPGAAIIATGGETSLATIGGTTYAIHQFKTPGTSNFNIASLAEDANMNKIEYLIVAGGGSGGGNLAGGGGGGGLIHNVGLPATFTTAGDYPVVVGAGGVGVPGTQEGIRGNNGGNSSFFSLTAIGGGGGGAGGNVVSANAGGSGGGGSGYSGTAPGGAALQPGSASGGFGFSGGTSGRGGNNYPGAGGGGAGAVGESPANGGSRGGNGGAGRLVNITGVDLYWAGGGGGGAYTTGAGAGNGGIGGGGGAGSNAGPAGTGGGTALNPGGNGGVNGAYPGTGLKISGDGGENTGGGGAGSPHQQYISGSGGSGIVIIRYPLRSA
jgi:hypothetical protein